MTDSNENNHKRILLGLMPFWSPLTPPLGVSLLKGHLRCAGYQVAAFDLNTHDELWETAHRYFDVVKEIIPVPQQGNFFMVGFDVLSNHMMAYLHKTRENEYRQLVRILFQENWGVPVDDPAISAMDKIISGFYHLLRGVLLKTVEEMRPAILGLSVYSTSLAASLFSFRVVKEKFPAIETVMGGGVFADHLAPGTLNFQVFQEKTRAYIDTIIVGEGELLFKKYLSGELPPGKRVYTPGDIHGECLDLSRAAVPDFSGLNLAAYSQMAVYASRSCPYQCNFCSETVQWGTFRKKKAQQVLEEIRSIKEQYGGKLFMFGDSLVNPVINDLTQCFQDHRLDIYWDAYLRIDPLVGENKDNLVEMWRRTGFYRARLGVESGSQQILDAMNKKITREQIGKSLSNLANAGIKTTTYWIVGYPGESEKNFQDTLDLLAELKNYIYEADWHPFYFFPGGQVSSHQWVQEKGAELLYPGEFTDLLLTQTWVLRTEPGRVELNQRMNRFAQACKNLDIPNPYSIMDIYRADKRWHRLHPQSGPPLLELHNHKHLK